MSEHTIQTESFVVSVNGDHATVFLRYGIGAGSRPHFGTLCVHSSYGTFGNYWSDISKPLTDFLARLDRDYLLSKISGLEPDYEEAESRLKTRVTRARLEGRIDADRARQAWNEIEWAFREYSGMMAVNALYDRGALCGITDFCDEFTTGYPLASRQFVDRMWPAIVKELARLGEVKE